MAAAAFAQTLTQGTKPLGKAGAMETVFMHRACAESANGGVPLQHPPCRQWDSFGACRRGDACFFRHDALPEDPPSTAGPSIRWEEDGSYVKVRQQALTVTRTPF